MLALLAVVACADKTPRVPDDYDKVTEIPAIYPDYIGVTIPCNIAPLTFRIEEQGSEFVTRMSAGDRSFVYGGAEVAPAKDEWEALVSQAVEDTIKVEVFTNEDGTWKGYEPFSIMVSADSIDRYISYRLIPPS